MSEVGGCGASPCSGGGGTGGEQAAAAAVTLTLVQVAAQRGLHAARLQQQAV